MQTHGERRARTHLQVFITGRKINRRTTTKIYGYHPEENESEWTGEEAVRNSSGYRLQIWSAGGQCNDATTDIKTVFTSIL